MSTRNPVESEPRKPGRWLPALLAGNLLLLGCVAGLLLRPEKPAEAAGEGNAGGRRFQGPASPNLSRTLPRAGQANAPSFRWAQLESEDYRDYIDRLRQIGCPEQTIRDLVIADLDSLMAPFAAELTGASRVLNYWDPNEKELVNRADELAKREKKRQLDLQKLQVIQELLGVDLASERARLLGEEDFHGRRLAFLPPEKRASVRVILETANGEEIALREKSFLRGEELTPEDQARLGEIRRAKEQALDSTLSLEERRAYDLWFSEAAYRVRDSFFGMDPTEREFTAAYEARKQFEDKWGGKDPASLPPNEKLEYQGDSQTMQSQIMLGLGPERFKEYQRAQDPDYRGLREAAAQFRLNPAVAAELWGYKAILADNRRSVRAMGQLAEADRAALLHQLSEETQQAMVERMGPEAFQYYVRSGAGKWIWE
jgi:hypothetical protein